MDCVSTLPAAEGSPCFPTVPFVNGEPSSDSGPLHLPRTLRATRSKRGRMPPTMDRVLPVTELFKTIDEEFVQSDGGLGGLAALARTCKGPEEVPIVRGAEGHRRFGGVDIQQTTDIEPDCRCQFVTDVVYWVRVRVAIVKPSDEPFRMGETQYIVLRVFPCSHRVHQRDMISKFFDARPRDGQIREPGG